jgi:hypothetical protein
LTNCRAFIRLDMIEHSRGVMYCTRMSEADVEVLERGYAAPTAVTSRWSLTYSTRTSVA